jgi:diguanylate cyclase (GGDEF)-like protein
MKLLIADDDPATCSLLTSAVHQFGHQAVTVLDGHSAWAALERDRFDVLVTDWLVPGLSGIELTRKVREKPPEPYLYVIILTGKDSREDVLEGLSAGADDYLTKPFDPRDLAVRLRTAKRIVDLQADLIAAREALRVQATRDPLTEIWNRGAILEVLDRELVRAKRAQIPLCLGIIDLDHFKAVNDAHGHQAGDAVLREAVARMRRSLRAYDALGRWGGEEFLLVFPECDAGTGRVAAERMRARVADGPVRFGDADIKVTCSVGLADAGLELGWDSDLLLGAADKAVYRAKLAGRNRVMVAEKTDARKR